MTWGANVYLLEILKTNNLCLLDVEQVVFERYSVSLILGAFEGFNIGRRGLHRLIDFQPIGNYWALLKEIVFYFLISLDSV